MKNFNTILILIGILSSSILVVENMVLSQNAFIYIYNGKTYTLCIVCIITGFIMGYGVKGLFTDKGAVDNDDFDF